MRIVFLGVVARWIGAGLIGKLCSRRTDGSARSAGDSKAGSVSSSGAGKAWGGAMEWDGTPRAAICCPRMRWAARTIVRFSRLPFLFIVHGKCTHARGQGRVAPSPQRFCAGERASERPFARTGGATWAALRNRVAPAVFCYRARAGRDVLRKRHMPLHRLEAAMRAAGCRARS